jgi:hypothetical protein
MHLPQSGCKSGVVGRPISGIVVDATRVEVVCWMTNPNRSIERFGAVIF